MIAFVLIGFRGVGKTSVARALANELIAEAIDLDDLLVAQLKMPLADFARQNSAHAFRVEESKMLRKVVNEPGVNATLLVLSLGGGTLDSEANQELLRSQKLQGWRLLWLRASFAKTLERMRKQNCTPERISLGSDDDLKLVFDRRERIFAALADHSINTNDLALGEVVEAAKGWIRQIQSTAFDR